MTLSTTITEIEDRIIGDEDEAVEMANSSPNAIESIPVKPTKAEVLDAIMTEAGCTRSQAGNVLGWAKRIVNDARENNYALYYPTNREMRGQAYQHLDAIMQHGQTAAPGSAHALLEGYLLDPTRDETGLFHDNTADEPGSPSYCSIQVAISVIR